MTPLNDAHHPLLVLALSAALIAFTVSYSVDAEPLNVGTEENSAERVLLAKARMPDAFEMPTLAPSAIVLDGAPTYRIEQGMVKFFFAPSRVDIPLSAENALQDIAATLSDGDRIQISGFHDETGNARQNIALSTKRAEVVRQRLIALGVSASAIQLKKPAVAIGSKSHEEARRVEVKLLR